MKKILVAVDLSPATPAVCAMGCKLAREMNAPVELLHVVQLVPLMAGDAYALQGPFLEELIGAMSAAGRQHLSRLARSCAKRGVKVRTFLRHGDPAGQIINRARGAQCIVLGTHGHGAVYNLFAGSTAQRVLHRVRCPVLVVPIGR
jgi:nucleotide-binding universal stress UspA family protein